MTLKNTQDINEMHPSPRRRPPYNSIQTFSSTTQKTALRITDIHKRSDEWPD